MKYGFFYCLVVYFYASQVFADPGDNVALVAQGGVATQSSLWSSFWPPANCINGITASNNNAQLCHTKKGSDPNEWWDVELPVIVPLDRIVIHNRTNCCSNRILGLYVLVSDAPFPPGTDAASLAAARAQAKFEYLITADATITTISVGDLLGKYVRIQKSGMGINAGSAINLLEVQVFEGNPVELKLVKKVNDSTPNVGDTVTFTVTVENGGVVDATDFNVDDVVPAGFGAISNISHGGTLNAPDQINWQVGSLASGASVDLTFDAMVLPP